MGGGYLNSEDGGFVVIDGVRLVGLEVLGWRLWRLEAGGGVRVEARGW